MNEQLIIRTLISRLEDCIEFTAPFNLKKIQSYCYDNRDLFLRYHRDDKHDQRRTALPLVNKTGEPDDSSFINLTGTGYDESNFTAKTKYYYESGLNEVLDLFGNSLRRTHIINCKQGGYFRPHRDGPVSLNTAAEETVRFLICIDNCDNKHFHFVLENKVLPLRTGKIFYINTLKKHSAFSFNEDCFFVIINAALNKDLCNIISTKL